jgi:hypothetical protein
MLLGVKKKKSAPRKKKKNPTTKKANPTRKRSKARASTSKKSHHKRRANPSPKKKHHKRRRNPGDKSGALKKIILGSLAGVGAGALVIAGSAMAGANAKKAFFVLGALGVAGGVMLAAKRPELGAGVAAGSLGAVAVPAVGAWLTSKVVQQRVKLPTHRERAVDEGLAHSFLPVDVAHSTICRFGSGTHDIARLQ